MSKNAPKKKKLTVNETGKAGGLATLKKRGKKHFSEIAKKRWEKEGKTAK